GGAACGVGILVALAVDRRPLRRVARDVVARQQRRSGAGVDAQRVLRSAGRHAELGLRRRLALHPLPHQLILAVGALVLEEQDRLQRRAAAADRAGVVHAPREWIAGILRAEVAVVAVEHAAGIAVASPVAGLVAIADIRIGARRPGALKLTGR